MTDDTELQDDTDMGEATTEDEGQKGGKANYRDDSESLTEDEAVRSDTDDDMDPMYSEEDII